MKALFYLRERHTQTKKEEAKKYKQSTPKYIQSLKVVSTTFSLICFVSLAKSACKMRKNVFYFTPEALFILETIFKFHDVIKALE